MGDKPRWRRRVGIPAALVCLGVVIVAVVMLRDDREDGRRAAPTDRRRVPDSALPGGVTDSAAGTANPGTTVPTELPGADMLIADLESRSTVEDMLDKGFPLMSNPRREAHQQTAAQTTEQVVEDMGNHMVLEYCARGTEMAAIYIGRYARDIPPSIKALRLIEEGRADGEKVSGLLHEAVETVIGDWPAMVQAFNDAWDRRDWTTVTGEGDTYYAEHHRYEHPMLETRRQQTVAYMSFYILANIERLDGDLLGRWLALDKPWRLTCLDMDVWCVDAYFQGQGQDTAAAQRHAALTEGVTIATEKTRESRWTAIADVHDFLLAARHVNVADIPTIEVLRIPDDLPKSFSKQTRQQVIQNFLEHVGKAP